MFIIQGRYSINTNFNSGSVYILAHYFTQSVYPATVMSIMKLTQIKTAVWSLILLLPACLYAGSGSMSIEEALKLARQGNTLAQVRLGIAYEHG